MSVLLPSDPAPAQARERLLDWSRIGSPQAGGDLQQLNRIGTRFAVDFTMPRRTGDKARLFLSKLRQAKAGNPAGAIIAFPQIGLTIGSPGSPVVNGAGQAGLTLNLRGFSASYPVKDGQFFSVIAGGRRYLHHATADTTANGSGVMALPIFPMLRVSPSDGAVCEFAVPMIEGLISGNEIGWTLARFGTDGVGFTVTEQS